MPDPTIDDLKALQHERGLRDMHVVWIGKTQFVVAHTDEERHSGMDLEDCDLHQWLLEQAEAPLVVGYYRALPHEADAYSEPYGASPWDFDALPSPPAAKEPR